MILWIFAIAYGRMTDALDWKPFVILAAIAAVVSYVLPSPYRLGFPLELLGNLAGFYGLFFVGFAFGRWRASRSEAGY
jgi:hypothetical protein